MTDTPWIKASASTDNTQCVEMRHAEGHVEIRDSKDPHGGTLRLTPEEWATWLAGAKRGEYDHLL